MVDRPDVQLSGPFDALYRQEYPGVVGVVYVLTGSAWVAEDLAQEAFLRALRDWETVSTMGAPDAWVRRVALNLAMSRFRRLRVEAAARLKLLPVPEPFEPRGAETEAFWAEVRRLPTRQAQAVALRYVEDLPVERIAEVLDVATGTVKALLHQGRERLARQLAVKGWLDDELR